MNKKTRGNILVVGQFTLLGLIWFFPAANDWSIPTALNQVASVLNLVAIFVLLISAVNLGRSLTANPVPLESSSLKTNGLYAVVRHPIYSALLILASTAVVQSRSFVHIIAGLMLFALLEYKARFEEKLLMERYPEYAAYAARVGRLVPFVGLIRQPRMQQ